MCLSVRASVFIGIRSVFILTYVDILINFICFILGLNIWEAVASACSASQVAAEQHSIHVTDAFIVVGNRYINLYINGTEYTVDVGF